MNDLNPPGPPPKSEKPAQEAHPVPAAAVTPVTEDPLPLGGGPALLDGWDSDLEDALEEAKHIGTLPRTDFR